MAGGKLEVQIGADITDFEKKIKEVEFDIKELSKVKLDRLKLGLDTTEINNQIKDAKANLNSFKTTVKDTGNQIGGQFTKQVGNGGNTLMQFSRIAQDAPFGIMGIGNNITATAESFSYLKQQTGSTGGALKALASSIAGTGGILLGVSLLTTGLTLLSQSGLTVGDIIDKITGRFDAFGATVNKIAVDAAKNSGQEIAGLNALISVAQDDVKSRKDRLIAVDELQSKFPAYFGNLSKEAILNGDLTGVTKELTKAIIARAEATAISDKIGELASKKLDLEIQKEKEIITLKKAQNNVRDAQQNLKITNNIAGAGQRAAGAAGALSLSVSRVKDLNEQILVIQTEQDKLAGRLNNKTAESIKLLEKKEALTKPSKVFNTPQVSGIDNALVPAGLVANIPQAIQTSLILANENLRNGLGQMELALIDFNNSARQIISNNISETFIGLGSAIGNALATGGNVLTAVGASLLSSLGNILTDMGKMAIQVGVGLIGIKSALKSLNPALAIGAGVALIALGSFFSSKSASIGGSMGSGGGSMNTGAGSRNESFTQSGFTGGSGQGGTVVFEIAGQKLIGVLSNTLNANRRLGGQLGL